MEMLQERDAKHAIKSMDANLAIGPVIHRSPSQPVAILESSKNLLDVLLTGIGGDHLLCRPIEAVGDQYGSPQSLRHQSFQGLVVEVELQMPAAVALLQRVADEFTHELR